MKGVSLKITRGLSPIEKYPQWLNLDSPVSNMGRATGDMIEEIRMVIKGRIEDELWMRIEDELRKKSYSK